MARNKWKEIDHHDWNIHDVWEWLLVISVDKDFPVKLKLDIKDMSQLKQLKLRVGMTVIVDRLSYLVDNAAVIRRHYNWLNVVITPGFLLGYWRQIDILFSNFNAVSRGDNKAHFDYSRDYNQSWKSATALVADIHKVCRKGISDWRNLADDRWSVTTLSAMFEDELGACKLRTKDRQKFKVFFAGKNWEEILPIARFTCKHYRELATWFGWNSFSMSVFIGFYDGIVRQKNRVRYV